MKVLTLRQRFIVDAVALYKRLYPQEYVGAVEVSKQAKDSRANIFGSDVEMDMRLRLRLPGRLMRTLQTLDEPKFLHDESEMKWFLSTFPEFRVAVKFT